MYHFKMYSLMHHNNCTTLVLHFKVTNSYLEFIIILLDIQEIYILMHHNHTLERKHFAGMLTFISRSQLVIIIFIVGDQRDTVYHFS